VAGLVVAIQIGARKGEPTVAVASVRALEGKGLEGDRFFKTHGVYTGKLGEGREITLIEEEALEAANLEHRLELSFAESRRNVLTRGVRLNDLVGKEFRIGEVLLRGVRLCEPCRHLAEMTKKAVVRPLTHRGGLNARILRDGLLKEGSSIEP
jgi:MOSC domain-containing protein YiiM